MSEEKSAKEIALEKALMFLLKEKEGIFIELNGERFVIVKKENSIIYYDASTQNDFIEGNLVWLVDH